MRSINWVEVDAATYGSRLPAGGYVIEIEKVTDNAAKDYLEIIYQIAEGEHKDQFRGLPDKDDWKHRFIQSYSEKGMPFFKGLLDALEASNPTFSVSEWQKMSDEQGLVGLKVGMLFRDNHYFSERAGENKVRTEVFRPLPADDVRAGKFEVPKPRYQDGILPDDEAPKQAAAPDPYGDSVPF